MPRGLIVAHPSLRGFVPPGAKVQMDASAEILDAEGPPSIARIEAALASAAGRLVAQGGRPGGFVVRPSARV